MYKILDPSWLNQFVCIFQQIVALKGQSYIMKWKQSYLIWPWRPEGPKLDVAHPHHILYIYYI